jgi:hypothetical protein
MLNVVPILETVADDLPTFDDFWTLWPQVRRLEKKAARDQWGRMSEAQRVAAVTALIPWRRVWLTMDPAFIVYPHRWLRGERWEDELPMDTVTSASHVAATLPAKGERVQMPDHVKAAIAKLRAK